MQVKFIHAEDHETLEQRLNKFLSELREDPNNVHYIVGDAEYTVVVEYSPAPNSICCECKWWDACEDELMGLCQKRGGRKRFSNRSCKEFLDVRG